MGLPKVDFDTVEDAANIKSQEGLGDMAGFQILGTWAGTITFEAHVPGESVGTWVSIMATNVATNALATTTTANGVFRIVSDGLDIRARFSTDTSGTANVWPFQRIV
ncbi:hypothetical protein LCGC14_1932370 [marine sediment metagenome]|uniref:Uncharacterized protein n=1 Tax=marine sediment metagenome TaxID=412755 RepID=A0A0F9I1F0_9ZZZZ